MRVDVFSKNDALIELFEAGLACNPNDQSELTALMTLDMTMKNGGVSCWLDYGAKGLDHLSAFSQQHGFPVLLRLADLARKDAAADNISTQGPLTDAYYDVMDRITERLYDKYCRT